MFVLKMSSRSVTSMPRLIARQVNPILVHVSRNSSEKSSSRFRFDQAKSRQTLKPVNFLLLVS